MARDESYYRMLYYVLQFAMIGHFAERRITPAMLEADPEQIRRAAQDFGEQYEAPQHIIDRAYQDLLTRIRENPLPGLPH